MSCKVSVNQEERAGLIKLFVVMNNLPAIKNSKPQIDLVKLKTAYQAIKWEIKII